MNNEIQECFIEIGDVLCVAQGRVIDLCGKQRAPHRLGLRLYWSLTSRGGRVQCIALLLQLGRGWFPDSTTSSLKQHPGSAASWPAKKKLAQPLNVSVEDLLGTNGSKKRGSGPTGKMKQLFEAASRLPRSQQQKITALLEPFIARHAAR